MNLSLSDPSRAAQRLAWLQNVLGHTRFRLERASVDAGQRSYWRAFIGEDSQIVMDAPPALEPVAPWLRIRALLEAGGVCVPEVLAADVERGFLLLQDLGPHTLLHRITPANADALFRAAIDQLLQIQAITPPVDVPTYDRTLLLREVALFDHWFLRRHLGIHLDVTSARQLDESCQCLIESALVQPQVLVHRDFMPRNLVPVGDAIAVIDFQDAVCGPISYDVLSLFKDAFIHWPEADVQRWLLDYHRRAQAAGLPVPAWVQFQRDVDWIGVQRHLKVLGIFARLYHHDHKPQYIADALRFVAYLEAVLPRYPELAMLAEIVVCRVRPALMAADARATGDT